MTDMKDPLKGEDDSIIFDCSNFSLICGNDKDIDVSDSEIDKLGEYLLKLPDQDAESFLNEFYPACCCQGCSLVGKLHYYDGVSKRCYMHEDLLNDLLNFVSEKCNSYDLIYWGMLADYIKKNKMFGFAGRIDGLDFILIAPWETCKGITVQDALKHFPVFVEADGISFSVSTRDKKKTFNKDFDL